MNWTCGQLNADCDPVRKSDSRVPAQITRSASPTTFAAAGVPLTPHPPSRSAYPSERSIRIAPLPANVSPTGIPNASESARSSSHASE